MSVLTNNIQMKRFKQVVKLADFRYETSVNVKLPTEKVLHALIKSDEFNDVIAGYAHDLLEAAEGIGARDFISFAVKEYNYIWATTKKLTKQLHSIIDSGVSKGIRKSSIDSKCSIIVDSARKIIETLEKAEAQGKIIIKKGSSYSAENETGKIYQLIHSVSQIESFCFGEEFTAYAKGSLLLKGEAGIGKTHLLCDFAKEALSLGHPVYIFLGEEFVSNQNPIECISQLLGAGNNLLDQIDAEARKRNKKALIVIDAINEAKTRVSWSELTRIKAHKSISLMLSIRSGYEPVILDNKIENTMLSITHPGLGVNDFEDISAFFTYYKVPLPDVPLIAPEFKNPLFLKIFCKTYTRTKNVRGHVGATTLFEDYVKKQTKQVLKRVGELQGRDHIWKRIIKPFAIWMGENGTARVLERKARQLIEVHYPGKSKQILHEMQRFWLLSKSPHYSKNNRLSGYEYRFPYQKFSDHLIARYLLNENLDTSNPEDSFLPNTKLGAILDKDYPYYDLRYGVVEAMAIQVPERLKGKDLVSVAPVSFKNSYLAKETFRNSLMWRSLERKNGDLMFFNEQDVIDYVNEIQRESNFDFMETLDTAISVSCIEGHPLNANTLHRFFLQTRMSRRDVFWQEYLHSHYEAGSTIDRYITWASSSICKKLKSAASIELTAITMSWFLASSDRRVRDRTTKALVNMLDGKYQILISLLKRFQDTDDIYILERLYAVAYGCSLRETNVAKIKSLAGFIYDTQFSANKPKEHILLRDYARGIVELFHRFDASIGFDPRLYKPPYLSRFPSRVPTIKTIEKNYCDRDKASRDYSTVRSSVLTNLGDFKRYVIDTNLSRFSNRKLDGTSPKSDQEIVDGLIEEMNPSEAGTLKALSEQYASQRWDSIIGDGSVTKEECAKTEKELNTLVKSLKGYSKGEKKLLKDYVFRNPVDDLSHFNSDRAARWIFMKVLDLGWDPKLHGEFDLQLKRNGYYGASPERIGKKYQWQALHQLLAMVSDNYCMERGGGNYEGPWQLHVRDIDPSTTIQGLNKSETNNWWLNQKYSNWAPESDDKTWLNVLSDLPDFKKLISVRNRAGKKWLCFESSFHWKQPLLHIPEKKRYHYRHREIWMMIKSYLVHSSDSKAFLKWLKKQHFMGRWMPESHHFYSVFYREFPNQPAFMYMYQPHQGKQDWYIKDGFEGLPVDVLVTCEEYLQEGNGYDESIDDHIVIELPARPIFNEMDIRSSVIEGQLKNANGSVVFLDPHIKEKGPVALLASEKHIATFLKEKKYELIWTVLGEKRCISGGLGHDPAWPGVLEFSGVYHFDKNADDVVGGITVTKFLN